MTVPDTPLMLDMPPVGETGVRIRKAAVSLFAERGYAATGIRDIAKAAGITTAAIYHHVENKEDLLVDIIRVAQTALNDGAKRALDGVKRPEESLAILVSSLIATHARSRMIARVSDIEIRSLTPASAPRAELVALRDEYEAIWRDVLLAGVDQGVFEIDDERLTRLALLSMCTGMSEWYRPAGEENLLWICEHFIGIALAAVHARRGRRRITASTLPIIDMDLVPRAPWEPDEGPAEEPAT
jgi:TetR/AcrR family transcriptional regulator, cholesterol catabolism regulator